MANEQQQVVEGLEKEIAELRRLFELYFRGIERFAPMEMYEDVKKRVASTRMEAARWRTVDKFRMSTTYQKFQTYDRMWSRELKAVEEGTSRRDKFLKEKARRNGVAMEGGQPAAAAPTTATAAKQAPPRAAGAGGGGDEGLSDDKLKRLYNVYMQAKKRTGESTNISMDGLKKQLEKQIPVIKQKHNCKNVEFKVVLKDGKAMLKAVPK